MTALPGGGSGAGHAFRSRAPYFSTIIATYNAARWVCDAVDSVLAQDFVDVEVIVVDDGSTDDTLEVLRSRYGGRIRVLSQPNAGCGSARNLGFRHARGRYITFLDSDDQYFPWALGTAATVIEESGSPAFLSLATLWFSDSTEALDVRRTPVRWESFADYLSYPDARAHETLPSNAVVRRDVFERAGGFWDRHICEDTDLWLRLGTCPGFVRVLEPLSVAKRQHDENYGNAARNRVAGATYLLQAERSGRYPGGPVRWRQRAECITVVVRSACVKSTESGAFGQAWSLYFGSFWEHVRLGKVKFLVGFPLLATARLMQQASSGSSLRRAGGGGAANARAPATSAGRAERDRRTVA